jgi:REP element-mobilizing transposase RayT
MAAGIQPRLVRYIGGTLRAEDCILEAAGGVADHVHLLVSFNKQLAASDALRIIKANSCRWIHESFPDLSEFAWQTG